jgi:hypothetical protein
MTVIQKPQQTLKYSSKEDAEKVLEALKNLLPKWGNVTLADLYDLSGLPTTHAHQKWGWAHFDHSSIHQNENDWWLILPEAEEITNVNS